ncbi:MAG: ABC transporter permease [Acidobacteriota bacterium]
MNGINPIIVLCKRELLRIWRDKIQVMMLFIMPLVLVVISLQNYSSVPEANKRMLPVIMIMTMLVTVFTISLSLVLDKQRGAMKTILTAPISRTTVILSRILFGTAFAILFGLIPMIIAPFIHIQLAWTAVLITVAVMSISAFCFAALAVFFGTMIDSIQGYILVCSCLIVLIMRFGVISGYSMARPVLYYSSYLNPGAYGADLIRYALSGQTRDIFFNMAQFDISINISALLGMTLILSMVSVYILNRKIKKGEFLQ